MVISCDVLWKFLFWCACICISVIFHECAFTNGHIILKFLWQELEWCSVSSRIHIQTFTWKFEWKFPVTLHEMQLTNRSLTQTFILNLQQWMHCASMLERKSIWQYPADIAPVDVEYRIIWQHKICQLVFVVARHLWSYGSVWFRIFPSIPALFK